MKTERTVPRMPRQLHQCASCGALVPHHAVTATHPEGEGRALWMCRDRDACHRRNQTNVDQLNRTGEQP